MSDDDTTLHADLNPLESQMIEVVWDWAARYEVAMGIPVESRSRGPAQALIRAATFFLDACNACGGPEAFAELQKLRDARREPGEGLDS